jgi:hypothetical protein
LGSDPGGGGGPGILLLALIALIATGCGEAGGAGEGATVSVYVEAPLCAGARKELASKGDRAGKLRIRAVCLKPVEGGRRVDIAKVGADARRATEDSSSVAYISTPNLAALHASQPILESVGVPQLPDISGAAAMKKLLSAIRSSQSASSVRKAVKENLAAR